MLVTNQTAQDYWFGPLHLPASGTLTVDDTSATSLYLTDDSVADSINALAVANKITVSGEAHPFPRPTGTPDVLHGDGAPEGMVYGGSGSIYLRRDNGTVYSKTSGVHFNTGWAKISTTQATAKITLSSTQSIPDNTNTVVNLTGVAWDTDSIADAAAKRLVVPADLDGKRVVLTALVYWAGNGTGYRDAWVRKNGSLSYGDDRAAISISQAQTVVGVDQVASGDAFDLQVFQPSGAALTVTAAHLSIVEIL